MATNPFTPTFGVSPPLLVGRQEAIELFGDGLADGVGSPARAMLLTGTRGSGKTVLLNALEDEARRQGWAVVSTTVRPGFLGELQNTLLPGLLHAHDPSATTLRTTGLSGSAASFGGSTSQEYVDHFPVSPSLRSEVEGLSDVLGRRDSGLLVSLDEVHARARDELREITQVVQHAFREGRPVALAAAGLPGSINDLLDDDVLTFLRRAERVTLGRVSKDDVAAAIRQPVEIAGRLIGDAALATAVDGTGGYPFLIQLVGHQSWSRQRANDEISVEDAQAGVERAVRRVGRLVHEPSLRDLSEVDRSFLAAMAVDSGPSRMSDIKERLGVDANYAGQYRLRLIGSEVIEPAGWGRVRFTVPYLGEYLRDHVARQAFDL